jgi:hypothetical protein
MDMPAVSSSAHYSMKKFPLSVFLILFIRCSGPVDFVNREQLGEFNVYDNGLIYDKLTMAKLGKKVDSLNLNFNTCAPKRFWSLEQGYGTYVSTLADSIEAHEVMTGAMTLEKLRKMFPSASVEKDVWIAKEHISLFGKKTIGYFSTLASVSVYVPDVASNDKSTGWVFEYDYPFLKGVYVHHLRATEIPEEYSTFIQYVDCLIDTTTTIFTTRTQPRLDALPENRSTLKQFLAMAMDFEPAPEEPKEYNDDDAWRQRWYEYVEATENWNDRRLAALDLKMKDSANVRLLSDAVDEAITHYSDISIDEYAARYLAPARALSLERSYRVFTKCGNDMRPTRHAKAICQLAVKANQWDIFLRAHLDVMNEYFYRYNEPDDLTCRKTYTKELEQLGVNSTNLFVGICLSSRSVNINHYGGSTATMGRALAESVHPSNVVNLLLAMIMDERLDLLNRTAMAYMLHACNRELVDTPAYQANLEREKQAVATLPDEVQKSFARITAD